jgi:hypothetical protein
MIQLSKASRSLLVAVSTALSASLAVSVYPALAFADVAPAAAPSVEATPAAQAGARVNHKGSPVSLAGEVTRYVVGPLGHVRGFVLKDGTTVKIREEAGDAMARAVPIGQQVRVEGWSPASSVGKSVMHAAVYGQHGQVVSAPTRDAGVNVSRDPSAREQRWSAMKAEIAKLPEATANGTVETVIAGRHGRPMGVVLADGTSVFFRPSLAKAMSARGVRIGDRIQSTGKGATYPMGVSIVVDTVSFADGTHFEAPSGAREVTR